MNEQGQTKIATVFAVGLVVGIALGYYVAGVRGAPPPDIVSLAPSRDASEQNIRAYKDALLKRIALPLPLSDSERAAVARAVLEHGEAYGLTAEETQRLNQSLR